MFWNGLPLESQYDSFIKSSTSKPSVTWPKMVCLPSKASQSSRVVISNCEALVSSPPPGIHDTVPFFTCFRLGRISSLKNRLDGSPLSLPKIDSPPVPKPVGSPVCTTKSCCTLWKRQLLKYFTLHNLRKLVDDTGAWSVCRSITRSPFEVSRRTDMLLVW